MTTIIIIIATISTCKWAFVIVIAQSFLSNSEDDNLLLLYLKTVLYHWPLSFITATCLSCALWCNCRVFVTSDQRPTFAFDWQSVLAVFGSLLSSPAKSPSLILSICHRLIIIWMSRLKAMFISYFASKKRLAVLACIFLTLYLTTHLYVVRDFIYILRFVLLIFFNFMSTNYYFILI